MMMKRRAVAGAPKREADFRRQAVIDQGQLRLKGTCASMPRHSHQTLSNVRESRQELHFVLEVAIVGPMLFAKSLIPAVSEKSRLRNARGSIR